VPDPCPHYINALNYMRHFSANQYTKQFALHFATFETDPDLDFFRYGQDGSSSPVSMTGEYASHWLYTIVRKRRVSIAPSAIVFRKQRVGQGQRWGVGGATLRRPTGGRGLSAGTCR
jgi:hypothetical protein